LSARPYNDGGPTLALGGSDKKGANVAAKAAAVDHDVFAWCVSQEWGAVLCTQSPVTKSPQVNKKRSRTKG
jgi:hypothetical protein